MQKLKLNGKIYTDRLNIYPSLVPKGNVVN